MLLSRIRVLYFLLMWLEETTKVPRDVRNSKSENKASSGEIGLNIRTLASPKVGQDRSNRRPLLACHTRCIYSVETSPIQQCKFQ